MVATVQYLKKPLGLPRKYSSESGHKLKGHWEFIRNPCFSSLKYTLKVWIPYDEFTPDEIKKQLISMSLSTIERALREEKNKNPKDFVQLFSLNISFIF